MKIELKNQGFKPIEIKITIETKAELIALYQRMDISSESVAKAVCDTEDGKPSRGLIPNAVASDNVAALFWEVLDAEIDNAQE